MTSTIKPRFFTRKRLGISFGVVAALFTLFGLLGYFWLPGYAKNQLETLLSETLDRPVTVQAIEVQPYTLEVTVRGFHVGEKANGTNTDETFISFDQLYLDLSIESVTRLAPVVSAITLDSPTVHIAREDENQFNFTDLIEKFSQPDEAPEDDKKALFSVSNILIKNGRFEFVDHFKQSHQEISEINLGIPFIANFDKVKANWVEPHFNAKINGAPFVLDAQMRPFTNNREATLALKLTDIDLTNLHEYAPIPIGVRLLSGYFDSDLQLTFSQVGEESPAINLTGSTAIRQVEIENNTVETPYRAALGNFSVDLTQIDLTTQTPSSLALVLENISLARINEEDAVLSLTQLNIDHVNVDLAAQQVLLGEIALDGFNANIQRETDGTIDLMRLFTALPYQAPIPLPSRKPLYEERVQVAEANETTIEADSSATANIQDSEVIPEEESDWAIQIQRFNLNTAALHYSDVSLKKAPPMVIDPINLSVENIDLSGETPLDIVLDAQVNQRGSIKTKGSLAWAPLDTNIDLDLNAVDLVSLQGWADDTLNALLTSGDISFQGNIKAAGEPLKILVDGQSQLANFNLFDPKNGSDLLRWKKLDISGIKFVNEPLRVDINTIKLGNFFAHVILSPEGELNLSDIVKQDETEESSAAAPEIAANDASSAGESKPTPVHIEKIVLQQGNVDFNDRFIQPNYRANLTGLTGNIGPLHANKVGKIEIKGALDKTAPLEISGDMDPFSSELLLDIAAKVTDIDLPQFSPYSGKYVGYAIEKGKLSVDIQYHVENGALSAKNNIFLDQFTLGEAIESEDAISAPLGLAIAILKNRRGEIDIHLPIEGSINDPQFSLGGIIFDAFLNLITRAITAPFSLLGSVMGGGAELSEITFAPGFATIDKKAEERLQVLADALNDRPTLKLEIAGHMDPERDHEGLKLAILQRKVKALKLAADTKKGKSTASLETVELTPEEYSKYLKKVYGDEDFEKPTNFLGLTKGLPDEEMEQLIVANTEVTDSEMISLAERRAIAAQSWLINQGEISADRVFVLGMQDSNELGNRVEFVLK